MFCKAKSGCIQLGSLVGSMLLARGSTLARDVHYNFMASLSQRMCTRIRLSETQQGHGKATQKIILRNPELTKRDGRPVRASGCAFYTSSLSQGLSLLTVPAHLH